MPTTSYDPQWVRDYYDAEGIKEWKRFDLHPVLRISFAIHQYYLRRYIHPGQRILEIGAGCGRFTQVLAEIGARVTVTDISPGQLALNRQQAETLGFSHAVEKWVECDVLNLSPHFAMDEFDAIVCYGGPISYVFDLADEAIHEMKKVVKPDGVLLLEVMTLWGCIHSSLPDVLKLPADLDRQILASGDLQASMKASSHCMHLYRAHELRQLLERNGLAIDVITASNALSTNWREYLSTLSEESETWQYMLEMEIEACREAGCLDMGTHMIAVCRKAI